MNDTDQTKSFGFFHADRAREIFESHKGEEFEVTFLKRTTGDWREMTCRISEFDRHDLVKVVEILYDAKPQGDMFGEDGPPTRVRQVPLDAITKIETEHFVYTPNQ